MQTRVDEYVDEGKPFPEFEQLKQDFENWFKKFNKNDPPILHKIVPGCPHKPRKLQALTPDLASEK
jgi:hypothetical protein